jgi:hypothetical protein
MTNNHRKMGVDLTPETSCISNTPQAMNNVQHYIPILNQLLSQTFRELKGRVIKKSMSNYCAIILWKLWYVPLKRR